MSDQFEVRSIDEEITSLVDSYDSLITPKRVWRDNNNKLYLIFRAIAAGFVQLRNLLLASKYRYDVRYCSDDDLESAMRITGEQRILAKKSIVRIVASNTDSAAVVSFLAGDYVYEASSGQVFGYTHVVDTTIRAGEFTVLSFVSTNTGAWTVDDITGVSILRLDGAAIDSFIEFTTMENSQSLGMDGETGNDIRTRLLTNTKRQDSLVELEQALNALPTIYRCNLIFNTDATSDRVLENGISLPPKTLLIIVTGTPDAEFAATVVSHTVYKTLLVMATDVVWYYNTLFATGKYPVYFTNHAFSEFYLTINYEYDQQKQRSEIVEADISYVFAKYKRTTQWIAEINEPLLYADAAGITTPAMRIKKIYLQQLQGMSLVSVALITVPALNLPRLAGITYVADGVGRSV